MNVAPSTLEVPVQEARWWRVVLHYGVWPLGIITVLILVWLAIYKRAKGSLVEFVS